MNRLLCLAICFAVAAVVESSPAQTNPCSTEQTAAAQSSQRDRIDKLLLRESEALVHLQQLAPAIRCQYADAVVSESCREFTAKLKEDARQAEQQIARYRSVHEPQPAELFDIYVRLETILKNIETLLDRDGFNGNRYQTPLSDAYNSFIKLTDVAFTGEIRDLLRTQSRQAGAQLQ